MVSNSKGNEEEVTKFERDYLFLFAEEQEVFLQKRLRFIEKLREEGENYWVTLEEADIKLSVILKSEYSTKFLSEYVRICTWDLSMQHESNCHEPTS